MNDDVTLQIITLVSIVLGIVLPLKKHFLKGLLIISITSMLFGLISFMLLVVIQGSSHIALYMFYVSMFLWMFGLVLLIHTIIQRKRRLK
jgi:hypothetical protein